MRGLIAVSGMFAAACSDDGTPATGSAGSEGEGTQSSLTDTGSASASASASSVTDATSMGSSASEGTTSSSATTGESSAGSSGADSSAGDSSAGDTGFVPMPCTEDADCTLLEDCCNCMAVHVDDAPPMCEQRCDQSTCDAAGLGNGVHCEFGSCQLDEVSCDPQTVLCDSLPPQCADGWLPSVGGGCWTGNCVPAEACDVVSECADCPDGQVCVPLIALGPAGFRCAPLDPSCNGTPDCTCMAGVCPELFSACIETGDGVQCECPNC